MALILVVMITVTEKAREHIRELVPEGERGEKGLRIFIDKGGCSGLQYNMEVDGAKAGDHEEVCEDVRVILDEESQGYLRGSTIDYLDTLTTTGFHIVNPNAKQTCGCGTSFQA